MINRDQNYITKRLVKCMEAKGCDALLLTWPHSIYYATGFASSFMYTSRDIGLSMAIVDNKGAVTLICSNFESLEATNNTNDIEIITYPMFVYVEDFLSDKQLKNAINDPLENFRTAVNILQEKGCTRIAVEHDSLDWRKMNYLMSVLPRFGGECNDEYFEDAGAILVESKRIKSRWESDIIRKGTQIARLAMDETGHELEAGMSHAHIANNFRMHCLEKCDEINFVDQYHTYGACFSPAYNLHDKTVANGDIIRLDGGAVIQGYYSDIARNYCVGGNSYMSDDQKRIYNALYCGYQRGVEVIGPGVKLSEIFHEVTSTVIKEGIPEYFRGHHGHSIGCGANSEEAPFISRTENLTLEPGMVMCLEVSSYGSINHSFNVEDTFLVTDSGAEWFTRSEYML